MLGWGRFQHCRRVVIFLLCLVLTSCGDAIWQNNSERYEAPNTYFSSMRKLLVEVAYEPSATPYTGVGMGGRPVWDFLEENLSALFRNRVNAVSILVPKEVEQMRQLPSNDSRLNKTSYRTEDIIDIGEHFRRNHATEETGAFFVVFLNGYFEEDGTIKDSVLGVSLSGTSVIAIFKPVVEANWRDGDTDGNFVTKYVEQSTLVHEMGHALGLVGNGLPVVHAHQDTAHGAHCLNHRCVMHWSHEASSDLRDFVSRFKMTQNLVVFDDDCLLDAQSYQPK